MSRMVGFALSVLLAAMIGVAGLGSGTSWARQVDATEKVIPHFSVSKLVVDTAQAGVRDVSREVIPEFILDRVEIREALRDLFGRVGTYFSISPDVKGKVTIYTKKATFESILHSLLRQVDANYRVDKAVYAVLPRRSYDNSPVVSPPLNFRVRGLSVEDFLQRVKSTGVDCRLAGDEYNFWLLDTDAWGAPQRSGEPVPVAAPSASGATISQDAKYLYILRGSGLTKVDKGTLKVLKRSKV